eukprot:scaffold211165_cov30-Tisochrysis_lutea.AAC.7
MPPERVGDSRRGPSTRPALRLPVRTCDSRTRRHKRATSLPIEMTRRVESALDANASIGALNSAYPVPNASSE